MGALQPLELAALDHLVRLKPDQPPDDRLLIVAITEADIRAQQQFPLPDSVLAQTLEILQSYQPSVVGLDVFRDIANPSNRSPAGSESKSLTKQLQKPNVISVTYVGHTPDERIPAPSTVPEAQIGFNDLVTDPDGVVRRNLMFMQDGATVLTSFSLQLALAYLSRACSGKLTGASSACLNAQVTDSGAFQLGSTVFTKLEPNSGGYQTIDARGYQILLSYRTRSQVARQVTLQQVLSRQVDPSWVKDKVVLLGVTAPSSKDFLPTPYSATTQTSRLLPGVVIHAQMVSQILSAVLNRQSLLWSWDDRVEVLWIWGWSLISGLLALYSRHAAFLCLSMIAVLLSLIGISVGIVALAGWVPLVAPVLGAVLTGSCVVVYQLRYQRFYDTLTDLPNRSRFFKQLQRLAAPPNSAAVLFLDLDRFNVINDHLGHATGDELLRLSRDRLKTCLRRSDTLARVGGDEFAILLHPLSHPDEALQIADAIQQQMMHPFCINNQDIFTSVSIGIALATDRALPDELLRDAYTAMYQAKAQGNARREVFAVGMRSQVVQRLQLETDLHRALEQHEFQLHYQPIVSLTTGQTVGFEALVRWQHPQRGMISPGDFIPIAEATGLIIPLGQWILQTACQQLKHWQRYDPSLIMSVNLSGQQLTQPDWADYVEQTLARAGFGGHFLKLEITESVAMQDVDGAIALLLRLKALNVQLSIDDFGTGYSSLSYLHRFPVDTLKIDRAFVNQMATTQEGDAIVQTIVGLAHNLKMTVVAEGVETPAQLAALQTIGCEYGQGYFFSKPLSVEAAETLLVAAKRWLN